jgi:uncharacterized protein (DUF697 family)
MAGSRRGGLMKLRAGVPAIGELFSVVRELSFDELRDEALLPPHLLLIGTDRAILDELRDALGAGGGANLIETATVDALPAYLDSFDGIVLVNLSPAERGRPAIRKLLEGAETAGRTLTFQTPPAVGNAPSLPEASVDDLRGRLVTRLAHRQLALGRYLPTFRKQAATTIINQTSRANAEFALLSNIPALIPVVGGLMAVGADTLVLTKNQLFLIYKLAAIHGRDLTQPWRIYTEMLPVVGAGIVWRTVARELAALIPFAAGTIPKVLVAYAGTATAGHSANFYYEQGERPTREQLRGFYLRAAELARNLPLPGRDENGRGGVIEGRFTEKRPAPPPAETPGGAANGSATLAPAAEKDGSAGTAPATADTGDEAR